MNKITVILLFLFTGLMGFGQDVEFSADTKSPVKEGERFRLVYSVNAEGSGFSPPKMEGFRVLSGPNRSSQSSIQIINGKVTRSVNYEYYFILQAMDEGEFTIESATITVDGKEYKSNSLNIRVEKGNATTGRTAGRSSTENKQLEGIDEEFAFLRAEVSEPKPMLGEQVIVTYKLYYRVNITDYAISQSPSYPGCWSQDITDDRQTPQQTEMVNGKRYRVAEIYKEAIFPQKTGKIETKPMEFQIVARVKNDSRRSRDPFESFFDDSFFGGRSVKRSLTSNPLTLDVKPLPQQGKPMSFNGAVGDFKVSSSIDKKKVLVNDAITLSVKVSGKGNVKLIDAPKVSFPPDFEVYDPEVSSNISTSSLSGVSGSKTIKYLLIPRVAGAFNIKPQDFSYYDMDAGKYKTINLPEYEITVDEGDQKASEGITIRSGSKQDIKYLGEDIRFIKTEFKKLDKRGDYFFGSQKFYMVIAIPVLVFIIILVIVFINRKRKGNTLLQNERQATKIAKKRLKSSKEFLKKGESANFYQALSEAIWGYIAYKFSIPRSELSVDTVRSKLSDKNTDENIIDEFIEVLDACEYARFAPGDKEKKMDELYERAQQIIVKTEKQLK